MSMTEKDLLKKLLSKREVEIIDAICAAEDCDDQIDSLLE
jgi:hypothetical protein